MDKYAIEGEKPFNNFKRALIIIRTTLLVFFFCILYAQAAIGYSQVSDFTLDIKSASIKKICEEIESKSDFRFVFAGDARETINNMIDLSVETQNIQEILEHILSGTNLTYNIIGNQIVIYRDTKKVGKIGETISEQANQQQNIVRGTVTDQQGEPLPGVTITIEGATRGVITDIDGSYSIEVQPTEKLVFTFIGMTSQIIEVGNQTVINIAMYEKADELDEVAIVAFGKQKKESVTAAITTVRPEDLKIPSSNLTTALAGRMSGLISYQRSGEPGEDDASFFIRGVTTLQYGAGPLILIDGVEMSSTDLARLQPDDIASFSIMKDAAATALYGARGGNGVIMVTTKEGREGKASISFRYETSVSSPTSEIELADPLTYMRLSNEAVLTRDAMRSVPYSMEKIESTQRGMNPFVYPANNWYDILFKKQAVNHRFNLNISGGGKVARYYIAATFNQDNGVIKTVRESKNNIDLKRYLLRSNININVTETTEAIVRLHGTFDDYFGPLDTGSGLYNKVMRSDPVAFPAYFLPDDAHKHKNHILFGNMDQGLYINPYADMVKGHREYSQSTMMAQFEIKQNLKFITEGLSLRGMFNTQRYSFFDVRREYKPFYYAVSFYDKIRDEYLLAPLNANDGSEWLSYSEGAKNVNTVTYFESAIDYIRSFDEHGLSALLVYQLRNKLVGNAGDLLRSLPNRNIGLSGRLTYSYGLRYFLEFNFGYNGSERFAKKDRFGFFPSFGGGWLMSNEPFWSKKSHWLTRSITNLKWKATYGIVGNDAIGETDDRFFYQSTVNVNNPDRAYSWGENFNYTVNGVSISKYANDQITWEVARKLNLGLELGLWGKIDVMVDVYKENRKNILQSRTNIPATMGLHVTTKANVAEASGQGIDLSVDINHYFNTDFWLTGRLNFTYATSEWTAYEEPDNSATPWLSQIGMPINQQWGYVAERLFVDERDVYNSPEQSFGKYMGGDIKYRDINGDDKITALDKVPIGFPTTPEIIYGFGLSTGYKGFDFSFFFQGLARESFWINPTTTSPFLDTDGDSGVGSKNALLKVYADNHWSEDNRNVQALWPRLNSDLWNNNVQTSTWFMRDGSFLRLKSAEFGYQMPKSLINRVGVASMRFYLSGTNLLTFSKFKLWDPEMAGNGLAYPIQRVVNCGIQLSF